MSQKHHKGEPKKPASAADPKVIEDLTPEQQYWANVLLYAQAAFEAMENRKVIPPLPFHLTEEGRERVVKLANEGFNPSFDEINRAMVHVKGQYDSARDQHANKGKPQ